MEKDNKKIQVYSKNKYTDQKGINDLKHSTGWFALFFDVR